MQLIIDGHNLIPRIEGMSLTDLDDESSLIEKLAIFCRLKRSKVWVFFDGAPAVNSGVRRYGAVTAYYVLRGITADAAIMAYIRKLGKSARNYKVVSSDRQVSAAAHSAHAEVISSEAFAKDLKTLAEQAPHLDPRNRVLTASEIENWQALFQDKKTKK